jgi:hypothetical protein
MATLFRIQQYFEVCIGEDLSFAGDGRNYHALVSELPVKVDMIDLKGCLY